MPTGTLADVVEAALLDTSAAIAPSAI